MKNKFNGLNTFSPQLSLPEGESPSLLNVDFDISGAVKKRKGTVTVFTDLPITSNVYIQSFRTLLGRRFLISKYLKKLRVLELVGDVSTIIWQKENVFIDVNTLPYAVPLENNLVLLLLEKQAPVQLKTLEYEIVSNSATSILNIPVGIEWSVLFPEVVCYKNGIRVQVSNQYSGNNLQITLMQGSFAIGDSVYVVLFSWQWWAEALTWYGDSFYQKVSRFGVSEQDKHVKIPEALTTDEIENSANYGVFAYDSSSLINLYNLRLNNQPVLSTDYSFSDGSNYTPKSNAYTNPTKFYITFGELSSENVRSFTDKSINSFSQIEIKKHLYKDKDVLFFSVTDGTLPTGVVELTPYYVKVINDDFIELYTDITLLTKLIIGTRYSKSFTDVAVDYASNSLALSTNQFQSKNPIRFTTTGNLPTPLSEDVVYFAKYVTAFNIKVYFDVALRKEVIFVNKSELFFTFANITADTISIPAHNKFTGDRVRVKNNSGTLPAGLNDTSVYYIKVLTNDVIQLYNNIELTSIVNNFTGMSGTVIVTLDGGVHTVTIDGLTLISKRLFFDSVNFVRLRQLNFNNRTGIDISNLDVYVDKDLVVRNIDYFTHTDEVLAPSYVTNVLHKYVSFTAKIPIGVNRDSVVQLINKSILWCGTAARKFKFAYDNGSYVPAYGIGNYADYLNGIFPTFGALFQSRLCLCGLGTTLLVSGVYDELLKNEFFRFFQITDDLSNPLIDPFNIRIAIVSTDKVVAIQQWQQYIFVFTKESVFRNTLDGNGLFNVTTRNLLLASNIGCVGKNAVVVTENTLLYLSYSGLYDMSVILQNEYRASEVSASVRNTIREFNENTVMVYDKYNRKVYLYDGRLYVYYVDVKTWSEYSCLIGWNITSFAQWEECVLFCCKVLCDFQIVKTEFERYMDFAKRVPPLAASFYVQPAIVSIDCYIGVEEYFCPIPFIPDINVEDLSIRVNGILKIFNVDWCKLPENFIKVFNSIFGTLTIECKLTGTAYGVVAMQDKVFKVFNNSSLGSIVPSSLCAIPPDNIPLESKTFIFYFLTIKRAGAPEFTVTGADYPDYYNFVNLGIVPPNNQIMYKEEGVGIGDAFCSVARVNNAVTILVEFTSRPYLPADLNTSSGYVLGRAEVWCLTTDANGKIPVSRESHYLNKCGRVYGGYTGAATLFRGNPGDRTSIGVLQPNGYYKSEFNISLPNSSAFDTGNFFYKSVVNPYAVALAPDIVLTDTIYCGGGAGLE